jgi:hypothetical protein
MFSSLFYLLCMLLVAACASSQSGSTEEARRDRKLDAPLRQKLASAGADETIRVFGKCSRPITDDMRQSLEAAGVTVGSVIGDIFTASCSPKQIHQLAALDFVTQLQLSMESKPLR